MANPGFPWPTDSQLESVRLTITPGSYNMGAPWTGHQGWVQFPGKLLCGDALVEGQKGAMPLAAEWVDASGAMHRLHPDPGGTGKLSHLQVREAKDGDAFGLQAVRVEGDGPARGRKLTYHVYWQAGEDGALDRAFDMFAGFES